MKSAEQQKRDRAKREIGKILERLASSGSNPITYGQLCERVTTRNYFPRSKALEAILTELSKASDSKQRGLISALVFRQDTELPGDGFFDLARTRDRSGEPQEIFDEELARIREARGPGET